MRETLRLLDRLILLGVGCGALVGVWAGRDLLAGRFGLATLQPVARGALLGGLAAIAWATLLVLTRRLVRGDGGKGRRLLAVALAAAPLAAAGGYLLNRSLGIRPAQLVVPWALTRNLAYLALCVALVLVVWRLAASRRGGLPAGAGLALAGVALLGLEVGQRWAFRPPAAGHATPDVLLILVDALRADHLSVAGYGRPTTPSIDELAADGILFRQAVASSSFTKTSVASLFTGRHPYRHGVYWGSLRGAEGPGTVSSDLLPASEVTLAEALASDGYLTAAWIQNSHLRELLGFAQGFVAFHDQQGDAPRINRGFLRFLRGPGRRWPWFAYLHYIDLHDPYRPRPPWLGRFGGSTGVYEGIDLDEWGAHLRAIREGEVEVSAAEIETLRALYDEQIGFVDAAVGEVLDRLRRSGAYDDTLIVLTADHGDAFLEHGALAHSTTPYEELVRVPLVLKLPANRHAGREITVPVRLVDVLPTLLDLLGRRAPRGVDGCSLRPLLEGEEAAWPVECATAVIEIAEDPGLYPAVALRTERWKYIHRDGGPDELYDLAADPAERTNLLAAEDPPEIAEELRQRALAVAASRPAAGERVELDAATIEELKALGYL